MKDNLKSNRVLRFNFTLHQKHSGNALLKFKNWWRKSALFLALDFPLTLQR
jgi:hypothetical protein